MWELHRTAPLTHRTIDITKRTVENGYTPLRHERRTYLLVARDMPVVILYFLQWLQGVMPACRGMEKGKRHGDNWHGDGGGLDGKNVTMMQRKVRGWTGACLLFSRVRYIIIMAYYTTSYYTDNLIRP